MYTDADERTQLRLERIGHFVQDQWPRTAAFLHRRPGRNSLIISLFPPYSEQTVIDIETYLKEEHGLRTIREEGNDYVDIKAAF